jgi:hypothetical protein
MANPIPAQSAAAHHAHVQRALGQQMLDEQRVTIIVLDQQHAHLV